MEARPEVAELMAFGHGVLGATVQGLSTCIHTITAAGSVDDVPCRGLHGEDDQLVSSTALRPDDRRREVAVVIEELSRGAARDLQ